MAFRRWDGEELFDREINIRLGVRYLGQLLDQYNGNLAYAVAAYNAGPMAVNNWIAVHQGRDQDEFVELIPYQETRLYVKRVLAVTGNIGGFITARPSGSRFLTSWSELPIFRIRRYIC